MSSVIKSEWVVTADLHLHPFQRCSSLRGADRLGDGLNAFRQTLVYAQQKDVPWIFLGDLKHTRGVWNQTVLAETLKIFREFPKVIKVLLCGNHDGAGLRDSPWSGLTPFESEQNTAVINEPQVRSINGTNIAFWPWQPTFDALPAFLKKAQSKNARVVMGHVFLRGSRLGPEEYRLENAGVSLTDFGLMGTKTHRVFDLGLFGDVHKQQYLGDLKGKTAALVLIPGSPWAQNWGEREEGKGALLVSLSGENYRAVRLSVNAPKYMIYALDGITPSVELPDFAGNFVRFTCTGSELSEYQQSIVDATKRITRFVEVILIPPATNKSRESVSLHGNMETTDLLARYMKLTGGVKGINGKWLLSIGMKLLEG